MEKIGFIGNYDKIDFILYTAKVLTQLGKKVLVVDTTTTQKARYIVPAINPTTSYVTSFEDIDVAVGFINTNRIEEYIGEKLQYDIALIDINNYKAIIENKLNETNKNYFVTAFDLFSLKKGIEILNNIEQPLKLTKILFERDMSAEDDEYLNFLSLGKKIMWNDEIIYFPVESGDSLIFAENQKLEKIKFKNLSAPYKNGIAYLINNMIGEEERKVRNIIKNLK